MESPFRPSKFQQIPSLWRQLLLCFARQMGKCHLNPWSVCLFYSDPDSIWGTKEMGNWNRIKSVEETAVKIVKKCRMDFNWCAKEMGNEGCPVYLYFEFKRETSRYDSSNGTKQLFIVLIFTASEHAGPTAFGSPNSKVFDTLRFFIDCMRSKKMY